MGEWVRYKLDQSTDHILVDEAQDTNERQWNIVRALALEYFAGEGASSRHRTLFTVGDYKQAIFGFQGTDPQSFDVARAYFDREASGIGKTFLDLSMDRSFRSSPPVLQAVDRVLGDLGHEALGLPRRPNVHDSAHPGRSGSVTLWQPYSEELDLAGDEAGEEGWISDSTRRYAARLARQIRHWLDHPFHVAAKGRPLRPEDILILVRRRGSLASLIVARLYVEDVPVAGVDRLLLSAPLAVQDLLAAARFALQPLDDLNLASLLVSPLFGWSQDDLYAAAFGRQGALWPQIRDTGSPDDPTLAGLQSILAMADYATPHQFFETILSGPIGGRRKLLLRLGAEARDPIEELLASALDFETTSTPSLQRFLDWFVRGDVEIVRDPSAPLDAVRVMTVHGSKGLQSPVVILADACVDPARARHGTADFELGGEGLMVPVFRPRKDELAEPLRGHDPRRGAPLCRRLAWSRGQERAAGGKLVRGGGSVARRPRQRLGGGSALGQGPPLRPTGSRRTRRGGRISSGASRSSRLGRDCRPHRIATPAPAGAVFGGRGRRSQPAPGAGDARSRRPGKAAPPAVRAPAGRRS
jgi:ATP-dependent helicase/nuclease subunit A